MAEIRVLDISAPMLKMLVIDCSYWNGNFTAEWEYSVVLDTPRLEYLEYDDFERESYSLKSLGSLLKADIVIRRRNNGSVIHLVQGLTSVQSVCLPHKSLKVSWLALGLSILVVKDKVVCEVQMIQLTNLFMYIINFVALVFF